MGEKGFARVVEPIPGEFHFIVANILVHFGEGPENRKLFLDKAAHINSDVEKAVRERVEAFKEEAANLCQQTAEVIRAEKHETQLRQVCAGIRAMEWDKAADDIRRLPAGGKG